MTAKPIMIQGTMSGVGKSLLTAGLCRILVQDGYKVAPFKSQNMALNSSLTESGDEMSRAQIMQARAAKIEPVAAMNPILLKPTSDIGSQVIVNGRVLSTMKARDYFEYKTKLIPEILESYESLARDNDIIVIEGAGSPVEINLKENDIVNMGLAKLVHAPVLLAGDIDRGGVFAQLVGTMMLFDEDEKEQVKGLIVNKFRGDVDILRPGLADLERLSGVSVLGVVPYADVDIEDEDSMSDRFVAPSLDALVNISIVHLPQIANVTDFMALDVLDGVSVSYATHALDLHNSDVVIVPSTKSPTKDLQWLLERGFDTALQKFVAQGGIVLGVCGGYHLLGNEIIDAVDASEKTLRGVGLLPISTTISSHQEQKRVVGKVEEIPGELSSLSGCALQGSLIDTGVVTRLGGAPFAQFTSEGASFEDGCVNGNVYGISLFGLFDSTECVDKFITTLLAKKGLDPSSVESFDIQKYQEEQFDKLADAMRENLDMDAIYRIIEEGV